MTAPDVCRVCQTDAPTMGDGLCESCALKADRLDGVDQAYRAVRTVLRRWEESLVTADEAMLLLVANERARQ